ncbi:MAG TPA: ABC transporter ATP-binding protein [bacterium]|jgi:phospholipid/cholesterol/gamma-HCH transport system ATP-binding protein|nr:ABC transporter ATP-binding protein [Myxococcales bacterium]OQA62348.1 MAG: putative ABC transporter ATP-binding protein [bacterium ADurb.Bin270]HPW45164.1 ABC transporter ATP-binding protein [bacterium]HQG13551.1 ABC transporter ATP-binding protein [bacterium]HQH79980.1 ABC transporter ATP-binding protein [bacterium]
MKPIIEFKDVHKSFGDHGVLVGAELSISPGETLTIIGGSGTGKSVFLKLLLGVMRPDSGEIFFDGEPLSEMNERKLSRMRRRIGMLFQGAALFDSLTVKENVAYPLREHFEYGENKISQIVDDKLAMVGLPGIGGMMPSDLSGGMKKRVGLARAIATDPDVILYDEPTTGLDPANTKRICRLIRELQEKMKVTSVVVTHDMEAAFSITDRLAMIYDRRIGFVGSVEEARASSDPAVQSFIRGEMATGDG